MKPKLSSSVSVVPLGHDRIEFFKTNTRQSVVVSCQDERFLDVLDLCDGSNTVLDISNKTQVDPASIEKLVGFLRTRGLTDNAINVNLFEEYDKYRRVISLLNDFSQGEAHLLEMWNNVRSSKVVIVGVGAVGSWVAINLAQSGIHNFVLIDPDVVEISNIHRQFGYYEADVGRYKVDVITERLKAIDGRMEVDGRKVPLTEGALESMNLSGIDLIVNCADKPNVDTTSKWVGEYCFERNIPHIVGGGYNLHTSLIGQTIIPGKSACIRCFEKSLAEENRIDVSKIRKLERPNRKIGSFGPMCALVASMTSMEALKVVTRHIAPANLNRRGQFDILTMRLEYKTYERRRDCELCGREYKGA